MHSLITLHNPAGRLYLEPMIRIEQLTFAYPSEQGTNAPVLHQVNLTVQPGEYVAILGHNGSGKSTLARHLNGLLLPTQGDVWVKGWNTKARRHLREIRATVGMVFQSPDNQIVATIVEEDIAFGPENFGVPRAELVRRVDWSLSQVEMQAFRHRAPHTLSGGQKQRICIAGVLAMQPEVLVLDEATAMLDPLGRQEVLAIVRRLHQEQGTTVIAITHFMHEAIQADRVVVMDGGQVVLEGSPRQLFQQVDKLHAYQLDVPQITKLAQALHQQYSDFPQDILTVDELVAAVSEKVGMRDAVLPVPSPLPTPHSPLPTPHPPPTTESLIKVKDLVHYYMHNTPLAVQALHGVDLAVYPGEIIGIIGHTGSGKSTAVQHFNGLLRPHGGQVTVLGNDLSVANVDLLSIRRRVGLIFQFPEAQLFERYVGDDVAYGPRNLQLSREEVRSRVRKAMQAVGLGFEEFKDRLTFRLSGGQMRRAAIAGVLALEPEVLVLDEPTAGLDPQGRQQLMSQLLQLHEQGMTLIMVSHNMDELAEICHRLYVLADGRTVMHGTPAEIFAQSARLRELGLDIPAVTTAVEALAAAGLVQTQQVVYTLDQAIALLQQILQREIS